MRTFIRLLLPASLVAAAIVAVPSTADAVLLPLFPQADLGVTLTDGPDPGQSDHPITYTAAVSNSGRDSSSSVLSLRFDRSAQVLQVPQLCSKRNGSAVEVTCAVGRLDAGKSSSLTVVVTYPSPGRWTVSAAVDVPVLVRDPVSSNDHASATTQIVLPGASNRSYAFGPGLGADPNPDGAAFTIQAVDDQGNQLRRGGAQFTVTASSGGYTAPGDVTDNGDGTYTASYRPVFNGTWSVSVQLDGTPITGSPFAVTQEQLPDATKTRAYGPGLEGGVAGEKAPLTVEVVDGHGQKYHGDAALVQIRATGPHGPAHVDLTSTVDGVFSASYLPLDPGPYTVEVLLSTKYTPALTSPVAASPFTVNIDKNPNEADASKCRAYGPGLEGGNTLEPAVFYVEVNTPSGQRYLGGDPPVGVDVTDPSGNVVQVQKTTVEPGVLQFTYNPKDVGTYRVDVIVRNKFNPTFYELVPGSPFSVPIESGIEAP